MILTDHITALQDIARFAKINVNNCKLRFKEFVEKDRVELTALAAKGGSIPAATGKPLYTYDDHCISAFFAAYLKASEALRAAVIRGGMSDVDFDSLNFDDIGIEHNISPVKPYRTELWNYKTGAIIPSEPSDFKSLWSWYTRPGTVFMSDLNKCVLKAENIYGHTSMLKAVPSERDTETVSLRSFGSFEDPSTMLEPWLYTPLHVAAGIMLVGSKIPNFYVGDGATITPYDQNMYGYYYDRILKITSVMDPATVTNPPILGAGPPSSGGEYQLQNISSIYIDHGVYTKDYSFNFMPFLQGYFGPHKQDFGPAWEERVDGNLNNVLVKKVRTFKEARASSYFKSWFETEVEDLFDPVSFTASVKNTKGLQQICNLYAVKYALLKVIYGHTKRLQTI